MSNTSRSQLPQAQLLEAQLLERATVTQTVKTQTLAPVQRRTLEYLRNFIAHHGFAPTLKDIAQHIGVRSPSTAHFHLTRLEEKGFISKGEDGSIELARRQYKTANSTPYSAKDSLPESNPELENASRDTKSFQDKPSNKDQSNKDRSNNASQLAWEPTSSIDVGPYAVPLLGVIAAGSPIEAIEDTATYIDIPPQYIETRSNRRGTVYCLQVTGDSMIDAHIMDGDIIIVRQQDTADDGQIVVALLDDNSATLKTLRRLKGGKVMLLPHNPAHKPITVDKVRIQGCLIGLIREY